MNAKEIPSRAECLKMLRENCVPDNIIAHSVAVADVALEYGRKIKAKGGKVNLKLLEAGALMHDIGKPEGIRGGHEAEISHGNIGAGMLRKAGYHELAEIAACHMFGVIFEAGKLDTLEKKLVYYADKRVNHDKRVKLGERIEYLINRYPQGAEMFRRAKPMLLKLEKEIILKSGDKV
jgi:uncharacterized protein